MRSDGERLPLEERVLDRLNPILVREIQQSFHGRAFVITLSLALACVTLTAMMTASGGGQDPGDGRNAFLAALYALTPILFFVVPFQAFLSTRHEVSGGTAEHLLLTRLKPGVIVRGKLYAAMVQFVLYLSLFAPLAALTFLLRGVDVPTIAVLLALAFLLCLAATSLAIALGAASAFPALRVLPYGLAALGLGGLTFGLLGVMGFAVAGVTGVVRRGEHWDVLGTSAVPAVLALVLGGMVGASFLAHPYENRSTRFRLFAFASFVVGLFWLHWFAPAGAMRHVAPAFGALAAGLLAFFWLFAASEEELLTPRVKTVVPRNRLLAVLSIPFLPGGGRGFLFTLLLAAVAVGGTHLFLRVGNHGAMSNANAQILWISWAYAVFFAGLARLIRGAMRPGPRATWIARCIVPAILGAGCLLPILADVLIGSGISSWHYGHVINPFWSLAGSAARRDSVFVIIVLGAVFVALLNLPAIRRGVREVGEAVRERRRRAR